MDDFDIDDIVIIKFDRAGMKKGELGIVVEKLEHVGMLKLMMGKNKYYNMLPDQLDHFIL